MQHILEALLFAANKHTTQRRKNVDASPYINHPIEVAELICRVGGVNDDVTLQAAILHDTIEDTQTTADELRQRFGDAVCEIVLEVTDDKSLPKDVRKQLQIEHAPHLSTRAKLVKLADKVANVRSVAEEPPAEWPLERRLAYFDWTEQVVSGLRGCNATLEKLYDEVLAAGRDALAVPG